MVMTSRPPPLTRRTLFSPSVKTSRNSMSGLIVKAIPISTGHYQGPQFILQTLRNQGLWQTDRSQEARDGTRKEQK